MKHITWELSKAGFRPSYTRLGSALQHLGNPQVLAVTATADTAVAIEGNPKPHLVSDEVVCDNTERANLFVIDQRNNKKRGHLASLVAQGEKTLIYVNSRMESVALVRQLRQTRTSYCFPYWIL